MDPLELLRARFSEPDAMALAYQQLLNSIPAAKIQPSAPPSAAPLPSLSVESVGPGRPRFGAAYGGDELGIRGSYQHRDQFSPAQWSAMLNYRKQF